MNYGSRLLVLIMAASVLASCTVSSGQGSALLALFTPEDDELQAYRWQGHFGNYNAQLLAVSQGGNTLFSNQQGDLLEFDGWIISRVAKLGPLDQEIGIVGREGKRTISSGFRRVTHQCQPWVAQPLQGAKRLTQLCEGRKPYRNRIDVNAAGSNTRIEQVINDRGQSIVLLGQGGTN